MPSLIMKTKLSSGPIKEKGCLGVCQKSSIISKKPCQDVKVSQQAAELDMLIRKFQVTSNTQLCTGEIDSDIANDETEYSGDGDGDFWSQDQPCVLVDSCCTERMESINNSTSNLETIFSPSVEPIELSDDQNRDPDAGSNKSLMLGLGIDDNPFGYQSCNISDFFISDMIIANLPFDVSLVHNDMAEMNPFPGYECVEPSRLLDMAEECLALPFLEETSKSNKSGDIEPCQESLNDENNDSLYLAISQIRSCNQISDLNSDLDHAEDVNPQLFIKKLPELSDVVSNFHSIARQKESLKRKSITLVLDLDETLVHSTLDDCGDADFMFNVFFNMKEHTVYVKQRPHLHTFLERVADLFEVIIFTASQSIYAEQLLDILDPEGKLISRRVYRESCIFSDGSYTKDLTVLGVDLAKVAIVDNSPQVFRLQVNNGIPIKSWFNDPSDCALISLLPFLETLVDADDVRPLIAKRFGNKE